MADEKELKTPGIFIEEISKLPPSVVQVETAVPVFIGYTKNHSIELKMKPVKISSMAEFENIFGGEAQRQAKVGVSLKAPFNIISIVFDNLLFTLYHHVRLFFDNGGTNCFVVSVGDYSGAAVQLGKTTPALSGLLGGLKAVEKKDEATLLVVPESTLLAEADYSILVKAMLEQSGRLKDRFAVIDVKDGNTYSSALIAKHRELVGHVHLNYGASYFPFLKTTLSSVFDDTAVTLSQTGGELDGLKLSGKLGTVKIKDKYKALYLAVQTQVNQQKLVLPPSGVIAGVYANVDKTRGVWKAPANVNVVSVIEPAVNIDTAIQEHLNVDAATGKSINVIRTFPGKGVLVWGARTLDGNSSEWRYISIRRFFIMVEESVKQAIVPFVFEPNDANTWVKVKGMNENYLTQLWRSGALMGSKPEQAFYVKVGLGQSMTAQDILDGKMIVEIGMATVRPAEFIILRISQMMQKA